LDLILYGLSLVASPRSVSGLPALIPIAEALKQYRGMKLVFFAKRLSDMAEQLDALGK